MTLTANPQEWPKIFLGSNQGGAVHGIYFYFTLEVLLRFAMVVGMAFGTLTAYFIIVAEWFPKPRTTNPNWANLASVYLLGALIYVIAGATYAATVLQNVPRILFFVAGVSVIAGVLFAVSYWKSPGRAKGVALILAQFSLLVSNAIARQWVQVDELMKWYDPNTAPIRGDGAASYCL